VLSPKVEAHRQPYFAETLAAIAISITISCMMMLMAQRSSKTFHIETSRNTGSLFNRSTTPHHEIASLDILYSTCCYFHSFAAYLGIYDPMWDAVVITTCDAAYFDCVFSGSI
jgi:hypothetical protein